MLICNKSTIGRESEDEKLVIYTYTHTSNIHCLQAKKREEKQEKIKEKKKALVYLDFKVFFCFFLLSFIK